MMDKLQTICEMLITFPGLMQHMPELMKPCTLLHHTQPPAEKDKLIPELNHTIYNQ